MKKILDKHGLSITKEMKKPMRRMLMALALLFGVLLVYHIFKGLMIKKYMTAGIPPVTVSAMKATAETWEPLIIASGSVKAYEGVMVTTQIAGMVSGIYFEPGKEVRQNELLIQLEDSTEVAQLRALEAQAALARINLNRDRAQFDIKAVSEAVLDTDIANVKNTQALVDQQRSIVDKKAIKALFTGRLGVRLVNLGQFLNPGDKVVSLQRLNPIYINFNLPQQQVVKIKIGQPIIFISDAFPKQIFKGKITTINPMVDDETRNGVVEATVLNPEGLLLPGMYGKVEVHLGQAYQQITVPQTAISYNAYGQIVYIIRDKIANQSFVKVGETRGDQIAVLQGIEVGDWVVTSGQMKLRNGSSVIVNNTVEPSNNPAPRPLNET